MTIVRKWQILILCCSLVIAAAITLTMKGTMLRSLYEREHAIVEHLHINGGYYWDVEYDWLGRVVLIRSHANDRYSDTMSFAICTLSYLEVLDLRGCRDLTDVSLKYFSKLPRLRTLHVENTDVTSDGVARFRARAPGCDIRASVEERNQN